MRPTRAAPSAAHMRSADEPRAKATRSPRLQPRASRAPAARRWRSSASAACSSSTVGASGPGHRGRLRPYAPAFTIAASWARPSYGRRRRTGPGAARTGETGRGADGRRHLDGLGHRRLPWAAGRVDQEPRGREDGDAPGLRVGPRAAGALVAEPPDLTDVVGRAQRRAPRAGRPGAQRTARPARHAEHRWAAPEGGQRPGPHGRDSRHLARGDVPQLRGPSARRAGARPGAGRRGRPDLHCGGDEASAAASSSRPPSASVRAWWPRTSYGPRRRRPTATCCWPWARPWPSSPPPAWSRSPYGTGRWRSS